MIAVLTGALVGLAGGVLAPLPAYRLSVDAGQPPLSSCTGCGAPVTGWLGPGPRCGATGHRIGPPVWLTGLAGGLAGGVIGWALGASAELPLFVAYAVLGVLLAAIDLACERLPDVLVIPAFWLAAAALAGLALGTGRWSDLVRAGLAAGTLGGLFLVLAILPGAGLGYGDVKLAALLGLLLGWLGWGAVLLGGLLPWLINGLVIVALLAARKVDRKGSVPFGPAMLAGALLAVALIK